MFLLAQPAAYGLSDLGEEVQEELKGNPFLENEGLAVRVVEEQNGYVTLEVFKGPRKLRELIHAGLDVDTPQAFGILGSPTGEYSRALKALRRATTYIRKMEGVKEVLVNAAINTPADRAEDWYKKGRRYYKREEYGEAARLFRKAADRGHAAASRALGVLYARGDGVEQDFEKAVTWARKAADQADVFALYNLGYYYRNGLGVPKDIEEAIEWWEKAAKKDFLRAQNNLAWLYATCSGSGYHDNKQSLLYAQRVVDGDSNKWNYIDTLAAAHAANGQFDEAVRYAREPIALLENSDQYTEETKEKRLGAARERLALYEQDKPYSQKCE